MKHIKYILLFLSLTGMFTITSCKSDVQEGNWIRKVENDSCGFVDASGNWRIKKGVYSIIYTDTFVNTAIVSSKKDGLIGIDKKGNKLYNVQIFDNFPDSASEGLFRIYVNKKYGFADMNGIVIKPKFDFVYPFSEGLAQFIQGCTFEKGEEHTSIVGGKSGYINKKGNIVIKAQYEYAQPFKDGVASVILDKKKVVINGWGTVIDHW